MNAAEHKNAPTILSILSFAESSFFPIPPDVMLAPMAMRIPNKAFWFAFLTTIFSVLGGIAGYAIGYFAFDLIADWLQTTKYWGKLFACKRVVYSVGSVGNFYSRIFAHPL